jgi:hypothetical protein
MLNQRPRLPPNPGAAIIPIGDRDGAVIRHAGDYARGAVLTAFEMIGGVDALATWARDNEGEFYTKMFSKVITREIDHGVTEGVEDLLARLDAAENNARRSRREEGPIIDAEIEEELDSDAA